MKKVEKSTKKGGKINKKVKNLHSVYRKLINSLQYTCII